MLEISITGPKSQASLLPENLLVTDSSFWLWQHLSNLCLHGHIATFFFVYAKSPLRIHVTALRIHLDHFISKLLM